MNGIILKYMEKNSSNSNFRENLNFFPKIVLKMASEFENTFEILFQPFLEKQHNAFNIIRDVIKQKILKEMRNGELEISLSVSDLLGSYSNENEIFVKKFISSAFLPKEFQFFDFEFKDGSGSLEISWVNYDIKKEEYYSQV
jgi:hypothetical protein